MAWNVNLLHLFFSHCLPKQALYLRRLDQVCHLGEHSWGPARLSWGSCIPPLKPAAICAAEEKLKETALIRLPWSTAPTPNHLSFTTQHIFQCLFSRKALLNRQKPKYLFLKVTTWGSALTYRKLAPFFVSMLETQCCCYADQQGSFKK